MYTGCQVCCVIENVNMKGEVCRMVVQAVMLCGLETVALSRRQKAELEVAHEDVREMEQDDFMR